MALTPPSLFFLDTSTRIAEYSTAGAFLQAIDLDLIADPTEPTNPHSLGPYWAQSLTAMIAATQREAGSPTGMQVARVAADGSTSLFAPDADFVSPQPSPGVILSDVSGRVLVAARRYLADGTFDTSFTFTPPDTPAATDWTLGAMSPSGQYAYGVSIYAESPPGTFPGQITRYDLDNSAAADTLVTYNRAIVGSVLALGIHEGSGDVLALFYRDEYVLRRYSPAGALVTSITIGRPDDNNGPSIVANGDVAYLLFNDNSGGGALNTLVSVDLGTEAITELTTFVPYFNSPPLGLYRGVCADVVLAADVQGNIYRKRTDTGEWATVYSYSPAGDPGENFVRNLMTAGTATNVVVGLLDTDVFGAWNRNVIYSTNGGSTWTVGGSITHQFGQAYPNLLAVSDDGTAIYYVNATGALGVFRSTDWGANWTKIADEFSASLEDRSVWSHGNHVWWQTRSGASRLLGRCELDGSNRTSFALPAVTHDQMMGSAIDDTLVCFSSAGVQNIAGNEHVVVTDGDGTPSGTQSATLDATWAAFPTEDYRGAVVTPISASLVVAKVNNLSGGAPTSPILLYTSASGTGTWTQRVSDPDANGQSSYNGFPATVSPDGTEVWQLLTLPHVWKSINGGVNWTSEDVPGLVDDGQNAWTALAYAHACGLPPPVTIKYPGIARVPKIGTIQDLFVRTTP